MNRRIGELFDRGNIGRTASQLVQAQPTQQAAGDGTARKQLDDAEAKLRAFQDAIAARVDPAALVDSSTRHRLTAR